MNFQDREEDAGRRFDSNRVQRASNNARNYGAVRAPLFGHPDAYRQCLVNVPSHLPILSHFCASVDRCACVHARVRPPIDPDFCIQTTMGGCARSTDQGKRREYGFTLDSFSERES